MLTKFTKGLTINDVLPKDTEFVEDVKWDAPRLRDISRGIVYEEDNANELAHKFIKENGAKLERIMGRKIQTK